MEGRNINFERDYIEYLLQLENWEDILSTDYSSENNNKKRNKSIDINNLNNETSESREHNNLEKWDDMNNLHNIVSEILGPDPGSYNNFLNSLISKDKINPKDNNEKESKNYLFNNSLDSFNNKKIELQNQYQYILSYYHNKEFKGSKMNTNLNNIKKEINNKIHYYCLFHLRNILQNMEKEIKNFIKYANSFRKINNFTKTESLLNGLLKRLKLEKISYKNINNLNTDSIRSYFKLNLALNKLYYSEGNIKKSIEVNQNLIKSLTALKNTKILHNKLKGKIYGVCSFLLQTRLFDKIQKYSFTYVNIDEGINDVSYYFTKSIKLYDENFHVWDNYSEFNLKLYESLIGNNIKNKTKCMKNSKDVFKSNQRILTNLIISIRNAQIIKHDHFFYYIKNSMRLFHVFFDYLDCNDKELFLMMKEAFFGLGTNVFEIVYPLIEFELNSENDKKRELMIKLYIKKFKHSNLKLPYNLFLLEQYGREREKEASIKIIRGLSKGSPEFAQKIKEFNVLRNEIIRLGLLLHEEFSEVIEECAELYLSNKTKEMTEIALNFHQKLNIKPETLYEKNFFQDYKGRLRDAEKYLKEYNKVDNPFLIFEVWEIYKEIYNEINAKYSRMEKMDINYVSSYFSDINKGKYSFYLYNIFTTYYGDIRIKKCKNDIFVFDTKQHPRKITFICSNEKEYSYLIKGHEDLRRDWKCMLLFKMCNDIFDADLSIRNKNYNITTYSILPLAPKIGIVSCINNCNTFCELIRLHRYSSSIDTSLHIRVLNYFCPKFESLSFLNKVDVFLSILSKLPCLELYHYLRLNSSGNENWLQLQNTFTSSLAIMSIVGYTIGLGDRHPGNLLLLERSGKVAHIDLGDLFDEAKSRRLWPEKVPFRLTKMLEKAMGNYCLKGYFRIVCEEILRVMRNNKEEILEVIRRETHGGGEKIKSIIPSLPPNKPLFKAKNQNNNKIASTYNYLSLDIKDDNFSSFKIGSVSRSISKISKYFESLPSESKDIKNNYSKEPTKKEESMFNSYENQNQNNYNNSYIMSYVSLSNDRWNSFSGKICKRILDKLSGRDFPNITYNVKEQVNRLINEATSPENLAQMYIGWNPFI